MSIFFEWEFCWFQFNPIIVLEVRQTHKQFNLLCTFIICMSNDTSKQFRHVTKYNIVKVCYSCNIPEHFGMSQTAIDVGVHRGSHNALLFSWWTFIASIQDPIVTSSLLNILKLNIKSIQIESCKNEDANTQIEWS